MEKDQKITRKFSSDEMPVRIFLDGIPFHPDAGRQLLINQENAALSCPFSWLEKQGNFYRGLFNLLKNCFVRNGEFMTGDPCIMRILIPEQLLQSPLMIPPEEAEQLNEASYNGHWKCLVMSAPIAARLDGILPELGIAGTVFQVDGKTRLLTEKANPQNAFTLSENPENMPYRLFFGLATKRIYAEKCDAPPGSNLLPVRFPVLNVMDPIGSAERRGLGKTRLLSFYPLRLTYQAELEPVTGANDVLLKTKS